MKFSHVNLCELMYKKNGTVSMEGWRQVSACVEEPTVTVDLKADMRFIVLFSLMSTFTRLGQSTGPVGQLVLEDRYGYRTWVWAGLAVFEISSVRTFIALWYNSTLVSNNYYKFRSTLLYQQFFLFPIHPMLSALCMQKFISDSVSERFYACNFMKHLNHS